MQQMDEYLTEIINEAKKHDKFGVVREVEHRAMTFFENIKGYDMNQNDRTAIKADVKDMMVPLIRLVAKLSHSLLGMDECNEFGRYGQRKASIKESLEEQHDDCKEQLSELNRVLDARKWELAQKKKEYQQMKRENNKLFENEMKELIEINQDCSERRNSSILPVNCEQKMKRDIFKGLNGGNQQEITYAVDCEITKRMVNVMYYYNAKVNVKDGINPAFKDILIGFESVIVTLPICLDCSGKRYKVMDCENTECGNNKRELFWTLRRYRNESVHWLSGAQSHDRNQIRNDIERALEILSVFEEKIYNKEWFNREI